MLQLPQWIFRSWIEAIRIVGDADGASRLEGGVIGDMLAGHNPARAPSVIRNDAPVTILRPTWGRNSHWAAAILIAFGLFASGASTRPRARLRTVSSAADHGDAGCQLAAIALDSSRILRASAAMLCSRCSSERRRSSRLIGMPALLWRSPNLRDDLSRRRLFGQNTDGLRQVVCTVSRSFVHQSDSRAPRRCPSSGAAASP